MLNLGRILDSAEAIISNKTFPEGVYEYQFPDQKIAAFYQNEDCCPVKDLNKTFTGQRAGKKMGSVGYVNR